MARKADLYDKLYTAAPAEFVRTRNAVAAALREAGHASDAAAVRRLRRPTTPVWALNQVARREPNTVEAFIKAVRELSQAQRSGRGVSEAMKAERDSRQRVIDRARAIVSDARLGPSPDLTRRISNTLLGAATDAAVRDRLKHGELDHELQASGFDVFTPARPASTSRETDRATHGLERQLRALDTTVRKQGAAQTVDRDAAKHRRRFRVLSGGRARSSARQ
jgi:hypothetical protein